MDSHEMRAMRRQAVAMARETIRFTRVRLADRPELVALLDRVLAGDPIPELADRSRPDSAVLQVSLELAELDVILEAVVALEAERTLPQPGEGSLSLAPTLADAWGQLRQAARLSRPSK